MGIGSTCRQPYRQNLIATKIVPTSQRIALGIHANPAGVTLVDKEARKWIWSKLQPGGGPIPRAQSHAILLRLKSHGLAMHSTVIDVVAWICIRDRQVLCARTAGKDAFYFPGGKREQGESEWEALRREVQEELNVSLIAKTLTELMVVQEVAHGYTEPTQVTMRCFGADYTGDIMANSEIEAIAWLRYRDLDQCAPATQRVVEYLYQQQWID